MAEIKPGDREVLDRAAQLVREAGVVVRAASTVRSSLSWPAAERLARSLEWGQPRIGDMPAQPPTVRARLGAALVRLVRRSLFWYTDQILAYQRLVTSATAEQMRALQQLAERVSACERHTAEAALCARIEALERRLASVEGLEPEEDGLSEGIDCRRRDAIEERRAARQEEASESKPVEPPADES